MLFLPQIGEHLLVPRIQYIYACCYLNWRRQKGQPRYWGLQCWSTIWAPISFSESRINLKNIFGVRWFPGNMMKSICIDIGKLKWSNVILSSYLIYSFGLGYPSGPSPPTLVLYLDMILSVIWKGQGLIPLLLSLLFLVMENYCLDAHWPSSMLYGPWAQQTFDNKHWPVLTWDDALSQWRGFHLHAKHLLQYLSEIKVMIQLCVVKECSFNLFQGGWPQFRSKHLQCFSPSVILFFCNIG